MSPPSRRKAARTLPLGWSEAKPGADPGTSPAPGRRSSPTQHAGGSSSASDPRPRRSRTLLALAGTLALLLALVLVVPRMLNVGAAPETAVREYLDALIAGDAEVVLEHLEPRTRASSGAITDEILHGASDRIIDYSIRAVERGEGTAAVTVLLDNGTTALPSTFSLTERSTGASSPATWELDPVTMPLHVVLTPTGPESLIINGVTLPVQDLAQFGSDFGRSGVILQLPPGTYQILLPEAGDLLRPRPQQIHLAPQLERRRYVESSLLYDLSTAGEEQAIATIEEQLAECARSTWSHPEGCPFGVLDEEGQQVTDREGSWEVTPPDTYEVAPWFADTWSVTGDGTAVFTPATASEQSDRQEPQEVPFRVEALSRMGGDGALRTDLLVTGQAARDSCDGAVVEIHEPRAEEPIILCDPVG